MFLWSKQHFLERDIYLKVHFLINLDLLFIGLGWREGKTLMTVVGVQQLQIKLIKSWEQWMYILHEYTHKS